MKFYLEIHIADPCGHAEQSYEFDMPDFKSANILGAAILIEEMAAREKKCDSKIFIAHMSVSLNKILRN